MNCYCLNGETYEDECYICHVKITQIMNEYHRKSNCPLHQIIFCCGVCETICQLCKNSGWRSLTGTGGGLGCYNDQTGERKCKIYNTDIF